MAAAAPSPLVSSLEKTNGAKLSRLLIDGGSMVLRRIFDRYHPPANLLADLNANYHTLNNLLRRRVLRGPQWDLLFPPGGATPDSNTFDITLLFLLLTNISGLSPPPSGWHTKPPVSDTSIEANLARIKFFRNTLYGHVTTTGIDAPTFSALWLEISTVLVALGLPHAEIDRLKAEHSGEEDFIDMLFEWSVSEHDIKRQLENILKSLTEVQQAVDEVRQVQTETRQTVDEELESQREKHRENEILKKLAKIDSLKNVKHHGDRYVEGTRLSIFAKVESWLDDRSSPNRVLVISGNAGMGKSVISAVMCKKMQEAGRLAGSHFCQHDRARLRNPKVMLQSLASQLCDFLPDYKKALVEKLSRNLGVEINNMEVKDLFDVLFEEPLASLNDPGLTFLMVIDGLDESEFRGRNELVDVIANYFQNLPLWIRFLVTTRPERNIAETLKNLHPLQLDPHGEGNMKDIYLCFEKQLSPLFPIEHRGIILQALVQKSEGVMLYAHYLVDFIKKEVPLATPEQLDSMLPSGISSVYHAYFKRLETDLCQELNVTEPNFWNFLSAVAAAREPLPLGFVSKLLLPGKLTSVVWRKVKAAIACVSALLPVQDECIHFFHKSVKDWLIETSNYGQHHFSVDEKEGHEVLSKLCINELDELKEKGVDCTQFSDTTKYALRHSVQHMLQLEDANNVMKFVLDIELVYAKLCVNVTAVFEDIVCVQKQAGIEELQRALNTLLVLLRKHLGTLEKLPHAIFQTLLNEGGPELSSDASHLLETKYSEMAYMEYLNKEDLQGRVQTKFQCSAAVVCFDVSPQLDYMVCECYDNTIQLWSLQTGKQLWRRDVKVKKDHGMYGPYWAWESYHCYQYGDEDLVYRPKSYRSVVFHPTEDLVLPGILSLAYTFDGDLKPLFLSSKCLFCICSISADKAKMLSDCPNDAKSVIMWSLKDGSAINRFTWSHDIASFAWSRDGRLLAISDLSGSIGLLDVIDGYRTLAQTPISEVFGMIKFSPDCRYLYCLVFNSARRDFFRLDVNIENDGNFSLDVLPEEVSYQPWEFESCSENGFLLGDPFCFPSKRGTIHSWRPGLAFVLNEQSLLTVAFNRSIIEMLHIDELTKDSAGDSKTTVMKVVLSLNGDTLFVITTTDGSPATLMAWDISNGMFKPGKRVFEDTGRFDENNMVAVREGILLQTSHNTLELWNFELSECIRSWTDLTFLMEVIPISEERVACRVWYPKPEVERKLIIVDTTREGIVPTSTFHTGEFFAACNSKCYVLTAVREELKMQSGDKVLWKMPKPTEAFLSRVIFSPTEQYCILRNVEVLVLDAVLGKTLHKLYPGKYNGPFNGKMDCNFVGDEECVVSFGDESNGYFLQLFNVKSGDLLSEIAVKSHVYSLAACPHERLIAIGFEDSKVNFKVLRVKLPGDKHSRKSNRSGFSNKYDLNSTTSERLK